MYLSRVIILNYRSIDFMNIEFSSGKNIIIGKNNSGKSNIITAINLVLGEASPSYYKSSNITLNDFHNNKTEEPIYICCEVTRESGEDFDLDSIIEECKGFYKKTDLVHLNTKINDNSDDEQILKFEKDLKDITDTNFDSLSPYTDKIYLKSDSLDNNYKREFVGSDESIIKNFLYIFQAYYDGTVIRKKLIIMYQKSNGSDWSITTASYLRNSILQSSIIPSFRDTYSQLRINNFSWYGKLLKHYTDNADLSEFKKASDKLKEESNKIFSDITNNFENESFQIAYPNTKLSLQCSPSNIDAYKLASLYVNDGFESLITEKGAGIQSMVIIGLFIHYMTKIQVKGSALLAVEEPELYLHPHARRVLAEKLDQFASEERHQIICTTHSRELFDNSRGAIKLIRLKKDDSSTTNVFKTEFSDSKSLQVILTQNNSDIFFSDKVILVEGTGDMYVLREVAKLYGKNNGLGVSWLDENNISIIAVGGKSKFLGYASVLEELGIDTYIMGDFDCLLDSEINGYFRYMFKDDSQKLIDRLNELKSNIGVNCKKDITKIKSLNEILNQNIIAVYNDILSGLQVFNIFILEGELETYLKNKIDRYKKEETIIDIVVNQITDEVSIDEFFDCNYFNLLMDKISENL